MYRIDKQAISVQCKNGESADNSNSNIPSYISIGKANNKKPHNEHAIMLFLNTFIRIITNVML